MSAMVTDDGFNDKTLAVARTTKVTKGGKIFSFTVTVVAGNGQGTIGFGQGKAREVSVAIQKASLNARRNMVAITLKGTTLQHAITARYGASKVFMRPASKGTGIIAGGAMRAVFEVLGVENVLAKCIGSTNPVNVAKATIKGLVDMMNPQSVATRRGLTVQELLGRKDD
jgi:small subunit ribosomal protein S5